MGGWFLRGGRSGVHKVGRVLRFTTPEAQVSHTAIATQHLADNLECYFPDLDEPPPDLLKFEFSYLYC